MQQGDYLSPASTGRSSKMKKRKIIHILRLSIFVMSVLIVGLSIFLVGRMIFESLTPGELRTTATTAVVPGDSSNGSDILQTTTVPTTETTVPTTAPAPTELLQQSAVVDAFFGPLPVAETPEILVHNEIRALYIGAAANLDKNIEIAKNSEVNAFVVDLKESNGVLFKSTNALAAEIGAAKNAYDLAAVVAKCHENDIKVIGRIVCFKDPILSEAKPEYSISDASGNSLFFSNEGKKSFANPYDTRTWDYNIDLAIEAIGAGIDEIQFDYVRFPTGKTTSGEKAYFGPAETTPTRVEVINRFLQTARIRIQDEYGVPLSADVFAIILSSKSDGENLGQDWATVGLTGIDSACPMIYPSHYALDTMLNGKMFDKPDYYPYDVLFAALTMGSDEAAVEGFTTVRPYLQAFTAKYIGEGNYITYGYDQINQQIKAVKDTGYAEWILWNPSASYPSGAYDGA